MGTLIGHVAPGIAFLAFGLWQLFQHTKLHALDPAAYRSRPWFHRLELYLIMAAAAASVAMELFIGPDRHQPLDPDGTIPANHLHNFEHAAISSTFFAFAALSLAIHRLRLPPALSQLLASAAFAQQLFLFHLHSADHAGPEGQYHALLQILVAVSLLTTLLGLPLPASFLLSFVRSLSILFQGVWLSLMGFALWTPRLVPGGCFINSEEGHQVVRCGGAAPLHRARSLVNILFSFSFLALLVFAVFFYAGIVRAYGGEPAYRSLMESSEEDDTDSAGDGDVESQRMVGLKEPRKFIELGKGFSPIDMGR